MAVNTGFKMKGFRQRVVSVLVHMLLTALSSPPIPFPHHASGASPETGFESRLITLLISARAVVAGEGREQVVEEERLQLHILGPDISRHFQHTATDIAQPRYPDIIHNFSQ